eukprot:6328800-Prymnesium_polylepis.1
MPGVPLPRLDTSYALRDSGPRRLSTAVHPGAAIPARACHPPESEGVCSLFARSHNRTRTTKGCPHP